MITPATLAGRIDNVVAGLLPSRPVVSHKSKYVHDPLWGTIEIAGFEQSIIDTPLVQRLRQIHQTGFVFSTYPSATHTRFEHTLGVMHIAGKIARALVAKYQPELDESTIQRVRLAALLHDTGHSAFSHTTEEIYQQCEDI